MWQNNCYMWYWNCAMWGWNCQMWEKIRVTTKCDKKKFTCDIRTVQYEDEIVTCEKKVT